MTVTMTTAPLYPPLSAVLWAAAVAVYARGACHLAAFALARRMRLIGRVYGWYALASGVTAALAFSLGRWQGGVFLALTGAGCAVAWRQERKRAAGGRECGVTRR